MPVRLHGVLRPHLEQPVQELAARIADDLRRRRPAPPYTLRGLPEGANAALLLARLWIDGDAEVTVHLREAQLRAAAAAAGAVPAAMIDALHARRAAAVLGAAGGGRCAALDIAPMGRLVVGHGAESVHESGLTLAPSTGLPVLPATALRGVAAAASRMEWTVEDDRVFGLPRPGAPREGVVARAGSVQVFDALPIEPPALVVDVLTPHAAPYYNDANADRGITHDPAEHHNPVPVRFLAVESTPFRAYAVGPAADLVRFVRALRRGLDELGIGGKTAAGYGYATLTPQVIGQ